MLLYATLSSLGGERGWLTYNWAWRLRGALDRLVGGVGLRRGRRHPHDLRPGDALDFWRVELAEPSRLLRLRAEMKVPGRAWLQFEVEPGSPASADPDCPVRAARSVRPAVLVLGCIRCTA